MLRLGRPIAGIRAAARAVSNQPPKPTTPTPSVTGAARRNLTEFPNDIEETPQPTSHQHPSFLSSSEVKRIRTVSLVGAVTIVVSLLAAASLHADAEDPRNDPVSKADKWPNDSIGAWIWGSKGSRDSSIRFIKGLRDTPLRDLHIAGHNNTLVAVDKQGDVVVTSPDGDELKPLVRGINASQICLARDGKLGFARTRSGAIFRIDLEKSLKLLETSDKVANGGSPWTLSAPLSGAAVLAGFVEKIECPERATSISASDTSIISLSASGTVYSCSLIGDRKFQAINFPKVGVLKPKISQIESGNSFHLAKTTLGQVFAWGKNNFGQLGTSHSHPKIPDVLERDTPGLVVFPKDVGVGSSGVRCTSISCGGETAVFVLEKEASTQEPGEVLVYSVGQGQHGQLGSGNFVHMTNTPTKIGALSNLQEYSEKEKRLTPIRVSSVSLGRSHAVAVLDTSSSQGRGLDIGRDVFVWGSNERGQLMRADCKKGNTAVPVWMRSIWTHGSHNDTMHKDFGVERMQVTGRRRRILNEGKEWMLGFGGVLVEPSFVCGDGATVLYWRIVDQ